MINESEYRQLKKEVDDARSEADRAQGALDQLMTRLKEEFECDDIKSAKALLAKYEVKKAEAQKAYDEARARYVEKWKGE